MFKLLACSFIKYFCNLDKPFIPGFIGKKIIPGSGLCFRCKRGVKIFGGLTFSEFNHMAFFFILQ